MTARRPSRPPAGFTLVELILALAISSIVIAGGLALLLSQERLYRTSAGTRAMQETARVALGELSTTLRRAGLGVDPGLALDFGAAQGVLQTQVPPGTNSRVDTVPYGCNANPVACRDRTDGPDEIVFYARDSLFGHQVTSVVGNAVTIAGPLRTALFPGQVLQFMCMRGEMYWAYATVAAYVPPSAGAANITLRNGQGYSFPYQNGIPTGDPRLTCFTDGTAWVAKVDRYRYFIQSFFADGTPAGAADETARTYLMLDQGLLGQDGRAILTAIAPDVEDIQFAYLFPQLNTLVGATQGTAIVAGPGGIDLSAGTSSGYGTGMDSPLRQTWNPSNIRAVRISLIVRTPRADRDGQDLWATRLPPSLNRPDMDALAPGRFHRLRFETTVILPNLDARAPFFPFHSVAAGDGLNVGGS